MGNVCGFNLGRNRVTKRIVLLLIGLDNAGKTKTVNHLVGNGDHEVLPTVGFKAVNLIHRKNPVIIYDLGGGPHFRAIWNQYYSEVHGVIFVVDSTDRMRLDECRGVLQDVLSHEKISGKPVLILANKQDVEGAMDDLDIVQRLNVEDIVNRFRCPTRVESYTASLPQGSKTKKDFIDPNLHKGYSWLLNYVIHRYGDINLRVQTDMHQDCNRREKLRPKPGSIHNKHEENGATDAIHIPDAFENPNYKFNTIKHGNNIDDADEILRDTEVEDGGVIMVKQARASNRPGKFAITRDSFLSDHNVKGRNVKLSPLFGNKSVIELDHSNIMSTSIELEARTHMRKLSPIVRQKFDVSANIESPLRRKTLNNDPRPHSSPSMENKLKSKDPRAYKSQEHVVNAKEDSDSISDIDEPINETYTRNIGSAVSVTKSRIVEVSLSGSKDSMRIDSGKETGKLVLPPIKQNKVTSDITPLQIGNLESHLLTKPSRSDTQLLTYNGSHSTDSRPHSASQAVRKQLEMQSNTPKKRKMSLKSLRRNRTSPESSPTLFIYDPHSTKSGDRGDNGDFKTSTNYSETNLKNNINIM